MSLPSDFKRTPWVAARILDFLNRARRPEDIFRSSELTDDPEAGSAKGYIIGERVARRIIEHRLQLPRRRFTALKELTKVKGLGEDKIHDLAFSFSTPAADAFRQRLYDQQILLDNWTVCNHTTHFGTDTAFREVADNPQAFADWTAREVARISRERFGNAEAAALAGELVRKCQIDVHPNAHFGAIALAFWFYRFDADNWFSFDRMRTATEHYLSTFRRWDQRLELRLLKDFPNGGALATGITVRDLPVVVNYGERAITVWTAELFD